MKRILSKLSDKTYKRLLLFTWLANIFDAVCTLYFVVGHNMKELNPIAQGLLDIHPVAFLLFKVFVAGACCWWLSRIIFDWTAKLATWLVLIPYTALFIYYTIGIVDWVVLN